jgi:hypothetical protein
MEKILCNKQILEDDKKLILILARRIGKPEMQKYAINLILNKYGLELGEENVKDN